jgi:hypothetical protein
MKQEYDFSKGVRGKFYHPEAVFNFPGLWREHLLGRYLRGEIERSVVIETVGIDWVDREAKRTGYDL